MMTLLPLTFGTHHSAWTVALDDGVPVGKADAGPALQAGPCRFCGDPRPIGPAPLPVDGNHNNRQPENLATACLHCRALHRLGCEQIEQEAVLIWAPDLTQPALNWLVRAIHGAFLAHGEEPVLSMRPRADTPRLRAAFRTYEALENLSLDAERRLGTTSPRDFGAALLDMPPHQRAVPASLRLLHLGRHHIAGRDVYRDLFEAASPETTA